MHKSILERWLPTWAVSALSAMLLLAVVLATAQAPPAGNTPSAAVPAITNAPPAPTTITGYVPDDKYKLRTGDKISLQILEDRDLPKSLLVTDSGEVDVPYVGRVAA